MSWGVVPRWIFAPRLVGGAWGLPGTVSAALVPGCFGATEFTNWLGKCSYDKIKLGLMSTGPIIFIAASAQELGVERDHVAETLRALGYQPQWADEAAGGEAWKPLVNRAVGVIQFVGRSSGAAGQGQSAVAHARQRGKQVWQVLMQEGMLTPGNEELPEQQALQAQYREELAGREGTLKALNLKELDAMILRVVDDISGRSRRSFFGQSLAVIGLLGTLPSIRLVRQGE